MLTCATYGTKLLATSDCETVPEILVLYLPPSPNPVYQCLSKRHGWPVKIPLFCQSGWREHWNTLSPVIGPLQLSIHVVRNRHVGTQMSHWDKTNKGNYHLKLCMPFVGLAPVRLLRPNMAVLYHVNGKLQRAYSRPRCPLGVQNKDIGSTPQTLLTDVRLLLRGRLPWCWTTINNWLISKMD